MAFFAEAAPKRVVSVNVCTDQLGMLLSPPSQLVSVTFLAREPISSPMAKEAQSYDINYSQIEELVALEPDLVLAHEWTSPLLLSMLDRFDIDYLQLKTPMTLGDIPDTIEMLGEALGQDVRASEIVSAYEKRLETLDKLAKQDRYTMAPYGPRGWMSGTQNLGADIIARAGFDHIADDYGLEYGGYMPLEILVSAQPDVILTSTLYPASSRGEALLAHPALGASFVHELERDNAWGCGTPFALDAYEEILKIEVAEK